MQFITKKYPNDFDLMRDTSIIIEGYPKKVRMANLAIIGSHAVNGVAEIHSTIIKESVKKFFFVRFSLNSSKYGQINSKTKQME